ncbi:leukocyte elastase inhibitor-like [Argonauta hians]
MAQRYQKLDENVLTAGSSLTKFTFELYNILQSLEKDEESNVFLSPYSISVVLLMVYTGARSNTATQMEQALNIEGPVKDSIHKAHEKYIGLLGKSKNLHLDTANRLYVNNKFEFLSEYFEQVKQMYHSLSEHVDFSVAPSETAKKINDWVENTTNGKIKDIIPEGYLNELTALVLVNAIYFKGSWFHKFNDKATKTEDFFRKSTDKISVDMMFIKKKFMLRIDDQYDCQIIDLPYEGSYLSMFIILPNQIDGIEALHKNLSADFLQSVVKNQQFRSVEVEVKLPRCKVESNYQLSKHLSSLGMSDLFSEEKADLSGMSNSPLYVSEVFHKAFVEVNEEGTEAAAATAAVVMMRCAMVRERPLKFTANHPFIFLIADKRSEMILFMGKLMKP